MNRRYPRTYGFLLIAILGVLIQACGGSATQEPEPAEPTTLVVQLLPFMSYSPLFFAEEEGYFAEQNLIIEFQNIQGPEVFAGIIQGELDVVATLVGVPMFGAAAENVKFVAGKGYETSTGCTVNGLLARKDLVDGGELDSVAQLAGRKVDMDILSVQGYYMDILLAAEGLSIDDIEVVDFPSPPSLIEGFATGALDLSNISEPWLTRINLAGNTVTWRNYKNEIPDFQFAVLLFGPSLLEDNPDAGRRFITAYLKAVNQYNEGKTERNMQLMMEFTGLDEELLEQICWPTFRDDGSINVQSLLDFQDWALERGFVSSVLTEEEFWDPSFIDFANEALK